METDSDSDHMVRYPVHDPMAMLFWVTKEDPNDAIPVPINGVKDWEDKYYPRPTVPPNDNTYHPADDLDWVKKILAEKGIPFNRESSGDNNTPYEDLLPHEMSDEQLWKHECCESHYGTVDIEPYRHFFPKQRKYHKQVHESKGFDIDEMPEIGIPEAGPLKVDCSPQRFPERYEMYKKLAQHALDEAINKDATDNKFKVSEVKSVNVIVNINVTYLITFIAANSGRNDPAASKTFRASVYSVTPFGFKEKFKIVDMCKIMD